MGVPPVRIDILTMIDGVAWNAAWSERVPARFAGVAAAVLGKRQLIQNKRAAGRAQDLADVEWLETHEDA